MKNILKSIIVFILTFEARLILKKYKPIIIAVTGSVGKTSTKDAIYNVLSHSLHVRKSEKSFNSDLGVPLTIIGSENGWYNPILWIRNIFHGLRTIIFKVHYPEMLILEVGADRPGDIQKISKWLSPDMVIITRFAKVPVHVEFFASPEAVIEEKSYLIKSLKDSGKLFVNSDDDDALTLKKMARQKAITYGVGVEASLRGSDYAITYDKVTSAPNGITFKVNYNGNSLPVFIKGVLGIQHMYPALAAIAVGIECGINPIHLIESFETYESPNGRMKIIAGEKKSTIIDDTYNSSPVAVREALETLKLIKTNNRKIAILGDMLELGKYSTYEHTLVGETAAQACTLLLTVGLRARHIAEGAEDGGLHERNIFEFENAEYAGKYLESILKEGDIILIKGSQGMRMERIVEEIIAYPERKGELLVRQEEEWRRK